MSNAAQPANRSIGEKISELGPTWLAGAIAAGPATMASVLVAGASFGYALLWVVIISTLLGALAQYLSTKLALATEEGLVATVERRLGSKWAWLLVADVVLAAGFAQLVIMKTLADVSALMLEDVSAMMADPRLWGIFWAVVLAVGLASGGYRLAELGAKLIVTAIVLAFIASVFFVPTDISAAATGLAPQIPQGLQGALVAAGVLGGAVHIAIITMQTYNVQARGWTTGDGELARFDIGVSMILAFGIFSITTFLVAAGALFEAETVDPGALDAIVAAQALEPIAGEFAQSLFLVGLLGAAVSTLGANTLVPPYVVADKLDWQIDIADTRYRLLVAGVALLSAAGAFIEGSFFLLLVLVLAFGLVGTPFVIAIVLVLLNDSGTTAETPGVPLNVAGGVLFAVASTLAGQFVYDELSGGLTALSGTVLIFSAVLTAATVLLVVKHLRRERR